MHFNYEIAHALTNNQKWEHDRCLKTRDPVIRVYPRSLFIRDPYRQPRAKRAPDLRQVTQKVSLIRGPRLPPEPPITTKRNISFPANPFQVNKIQSGPSAGSRSRSRLHVRFLIEDRKQEDFNNPVKQAFATATSIGPRICNPRQ